MQVYLPWIDACTLAKERPKGQGHAGMTSGVHFDGETGKASIINESNVQYQKQFPGYQTLLMH